MIILLAILVIISAITVIVNFSYFLLKGRLKMRKDLWKYFEFLTVAIIPIIYLLSMDLNSAIDCCSPHGPIFSPDHKVGIYVLMILGISAYTISVFRKDLFPPIMEFFINLFLVVGLIINVLLCFHFATSDLIKTFLLIFGNLPIILLILLKLTEHHRKLKGNIMENEIEPDSTVSKFCYAILKLEPIYKYPVLCVLLAPVTILLSLFLTLFGQKPDSLISAFTDTYYYGFSELDFLCDNVICGGHFLCSVGANGHKNVVKPIRYGERNGNRIICNRQLLVSNAFEELIQQCFPRFHKHLRNSYNKVGNYVHKHYYLFNIKFISDFIYILMKPLEWLFLIVLYMFDKQPENRIAMQYLSEKDRQKILTS